MNKKLYNYKTIDFKSIYNFKSETCDTYANKCNNIFQILWKSNVGYFSKSFNEITFYIVLRFYLEKIDYVYDIHLFQKKLLHIYMSLVSSINTYL